MSEGQKQADLAAVAPDITFKVIPTSKRVTPSGRERILADPGFGKVFTEHMAQLSWDRGHGWRDAQLPPATPPAPPPPAPPPRPPPPAPPSGGAPRVAAAGGGGPPPPARNKNPVFSPPPGGG